MKRWVHASSDAKYNIHPGDAVTVYNGKHGYSNYDAIFEGYFTNNYGVKMAKLSVRGEDSEVPASSIIPSEKDWFHSASIDEILTKDFVASLIHRGDSMWCRKIRVPRVDKDSGIENVTGIEADIMGTREGEPVFRVVITSYISKHYQEDRDIEDESGLSVDDPLVDEALDILKQAPEVIVNYAGYQRIFRQ